MDEFIAITRRGYSGKAVFQLALIRGFPYISSGFGF